MQWREELRTVDERVRAVVGAKDQVRTVCGLDNASTNVRVTLVHYTAARLVTMGALPQLKSRAIIIVTVRVDFGVAISGSV